MDQRASVSDQLPMHLCRSQAEASPLQVSINTSPARKHCFVPSPTSPTKSVTGTVIQMARSPISKEESQETVSAPSDASNTRESLLPATFQPVRSHDNGLRHLPSLNKHDGPLEHSMDFFDSDSSEIQLRVPNFGREQLGDELVFPLPPETSENLAVFDDKVETHRELAQHSVVPDIDGYLKLAEINGSSNPHRLSQHVDQPSLDTTCLHSPAQLPVTNQFPSSEAWPASQDFGRGADFSPADPPESCAKKISSRSSKDRYPLDLYRMMLQANQVALETILGNNGKFPRSQPAVSAASQVKGNLDVTEADVAPARPSRPALSHGKFIINADKPVETEQLSMQETIPKRSANKSKNVRSISSPPAPERGRQNANLAPSHIPVPSQAFEKRDAPQVQTPFSYPAQGARTQANSVKSRAVETSSASRGLSQNPKCRGNQDFVRRSPVSSDTLQSPAVELFIFVRRRYSPLGVRTASIIIPREFQLPKSTLCSAVRDNEKHFLSIDFDDTLLLKQLRQQYYHILLGDKTPGRLWRRIGSARVLKYINIAHMYEQQRHENATITTACHRTNEILQKDLMRSFRTPAMAKGRYAWVQWAQRIAIDSTQYPMEELTPPESSTTRDPEVNMVRKPGIDMSVCDPLGSVCYGLEFVEGWSVLRIFFVVFIVLLAGVAATLLWIFLGPDLDAGISATPRFLRGATRAARLLPGCGIGILVLLLGWGILVVWIGASYLAMSAGCPRERSVQ